MSAPEPRPGLPGRLAEIALLRTAMKYGQTPAVRQDAEERLIALGADLRAPEEE